MGLEGHCDVPDTVTPTDTDTVDDMTPRRSVSGSKQTDTQTQLPYYTIFYCVHFYRQKIKYKDADDDVRLKYNSASTGPGAGLVPLRTNIASVRSLNIFCTGLGPRVAFALLFLFISYKPHFTSATKKKLTSMVS